MEKKIKKLQIVRFFIALKSQQLAGYIRAPSQFGAMETKCMGKD